MPDLATPQGVLLSLLGKLGVPVLILCGLYVLWVAADWVRAARNGIRHGQQAAMWAESALKDAATRRSTLMAVVFALGIVTLVVIEASAIASYAAYVLDPENGLRESYLPPVFLLQRPSHELPTVLGLGSWPPIVMQVVIATIVVLVLDLLSAIVGLDVPGKLAGFALGVYAFANVMVGGVCGGIWVLGILIAWDRADGDGPVGLADLDSLFGGSPLLAALVHLLFGLGIAFIPMWITGKYSDARNQVRQTR